MLSHVFLKFSPIPSRWASTALLCGGSSGSSAAKSAPKSGESFPIPGNQYFLNVVFFSWPCFLHLLKFLSLWAHLTQYSFRIHHSLPSSVFTIFLVTPSTYELVLKQQKWGGQIFSEENRPSVEFVPNECVCASLNIFRQTKMNVSSLLFLFNLIMSPL